MKSANKPQPSLSSKKWRSATSIVAAGSPDSPIKGEAISASELSASDHNDRYGNAGNAADAADKSDLPEATPALATPQAVDGADDATKSKRVNVSCSRFTLGKPGQVFELRRPGAPKGNA